jgi:mannosyl-oligosaccharide alpha-1,2-mannosidase
MEYKYLAHLTGRKEYFQTVERVMDIMQRHQAANGLLATTWNVADGTPIGG